MPELRSASLLCTARLIPKPSLWAQLPIDVGAAPSPAVGRSSVNPPACCHRRYPAGGELHAGSTGELVCVRKQPDLTALRAALEVRCNTVTLHGRHSQQATPAALLQAFCGMQCVMPPPSALKYPVCALLQRVLASGITSCAVVLKHAAIYADHELAVGQLAASMGFKQVRGCAGGGRGGDGVRAWGEGGGRGARVWPLLPLAW